MVATLLTLFARCLCGASEETLFSFCPWHFRRGGSARSLPLYFSRLSSRCLHRHGLPGSGRRRRSSSWATGMGRAPWFRGFELSRVVRARPRMQQGSVRGVVFFFPVFFFSVLCLCVRAFFVFVSEFFFVFFLMRFRVFFWVGLSRAVRGYTNPILS